MPPSLKASILQRRPVRPAFQRGILGRIYKFLSVDVWVVEIQSMPAAKRVFYKLARIAYLAWRGFFGDDCLFRASALTYITVLSLVPLLALAFSMLRGLGFYKQLMEETVLPFLDDQVPRGVDPVTQEVAAHPLRDAIDQVLLFVNETDFGALNVFGLAILIYAVLKMLGTIEGSFNEIWGVQRPRSFVRKVSDYLTMVIVTPVFLVIAIGLTTMAQSAGVTGFLRDYLHLGPVLDVLIGLTPLFAGWIAFTFVYLVLPNTRTQFSSAVLGAFIAGTLWHIALTLHVKFQVGLANYNAIYASFAAIPIFLVWVQFSWVIVLLGAEIAFAHQHVHAYKKIAGYRSHGHAVKEIVALRALTRIADAFLAGREPQGAEAIAQELGIPLRPVEDVLIALQGGGLLVAAEPLDAGRFVLARDPGLITLKSALDVLKGKGQEHDVPARHPADEEVDRLLALMEREAEGSAYNRTLRDLVLEVARRRVEAGAQALEPRAQPS